MIFCGAKVMEGEAEGVLNAKKLCTGQAGSVS